MMYQHPWRDFQDWVKESKAPDQNLCVSKLKPKTTGEVTSCTPAVVNQVFNDFSGLCHLAGITKNGVLCKEHCGRLVLVDEKGFSASG